MNSTTTADMASACLSAAVWGALRQRLQRRMRGVAQEDYTSFVPMPDRIAVPDRLAAAKVEHRQQRLHRRMGVPVGVLELGAVSRHIPPF